MTPHTGGWIVGLETTEDAARTFMDALEPLGNAASAYETSTGGTWRVELYSLNPPDRAALVATVALAAAAAGAPEPDFTVRRLAARDWLAENRASFQPLCAGRYFIHPTRYEGAPPAGSISLALDAATAFGTGRHGATQGCLMALDRLARRRRPRRILDMGCGSGILAIAAAKTWRRPVLAVDIDAEAARVARANARANGVGSLVRAKRADGFTGVPRNKRFDLILANILARPLADMAPALARRLAPGGTAVLSGLLVEQEAQVRTAYRAQGMRLVTRIDIEGWRTLLLR